MVKCDICGHQLEIDQDGMAHCKHCGMSYTVEAIRKKYQENNTEIKENKVSLKITKIQTSIFAKECTIIAEVLEGKLKAREFLCLKGDKNIAYKVAWVQEYSGDSVRFRLEGVTKKMVNVGQILETSYEMEKRFTRILHKNFGFYRIHENVAIEEGFHPISYMLLEEKTPKVAILLCNSRSYNTKPIQNTMQMCKDANIPVLRFYKDFRNDEDYICNRIKSVL